ncbi:ATP-binding protein [Dactylosporangium matsuzakiense]|uniref:Sensor-like histidine kinase SenX3 n=1 Tax=Dactylosporangium matsuzakiense TaxID=53360 RepID=A0A9W6KQ26_9ACTN|nr:histidine kinase dimerization/phospho-acceptor domain-containing protein [Dactylosporangium matsuzakiense]UWZ47453.1 hypothetical protein Dmats_14225 [Dactylosporangium matsuzakiense]GLL05208.1 hypothetical protein GCM10017581_069550 [Dactylosporangium matsuzakiense]
MPPAQAELLRLAAHELRTPLTSIRGYSELLATGRAGELTDQQQRMASLIDLCAGKVYATIEALIVLIGIGDGTFGLAVEPTRLAPLAVRAAAEVATRARVAGVAIDVAVADDVTLLADPRHLQRALAELLGTAIDLAPRDGTVRLAASTRPAASPVSPRPAAAVPVPAAAVPVPAATHLVVTCPPGGPAAGEQLALYDRCLCAAPALADLEGPGLGLAVAHAVVAHHGGTIAATADDTGVTVTVTLPSAPPDDPSHIVLRRRAFSGSPRD